MAGDAPGTAHKNPDSGFPSPPAPLALYRKYRPAAFAEVKGQEHVTEPLRQALRNGRVHHAYLFSGPRGCGKTSSARILARSLNCEQGPTPDPCGVCASCVALAPSGPGSIDVIEIDAASHGGVDDARDLRERAFYAPVSGRFKIYIIDEAHMVTREGFNALLKLVEEPPPHLKFVFATTEPEKVIATIRSRTHHYPFRLVPPAVLRALLEEILSTEGVSYQPAVLPLVVRAGAGSVRDALSVLDQLLAGSGPDGLTYDRTVALLGYTDDSLLDEMMDAFATGNGAAVFGAVDRVVEGGHDPRRFAADLLDRLRDLIILAAVPGAGQSGLLDAPADRLERMAEQAGRFGQAELTRAAEIISEGLIQMRGTAAPRLLLELMCAQVLLPAASTGEKALLARLERLEHQLAGVATGHDEATGQSAPSRDIPREAGRPGDTPAGAAPGGKRSRRDAPPGGESAPGDAAPDGGGRAGRAGPRDARDQPGGPDPGLADADPQGDAGSRGDTRSRGTGPRGGTDPGGDASPRGGTGSRGGTGPRHGTRPGGTGPGGTGPGGDASLRGGSGPGADTGPRGGTGPLGGTGPGGDTGSRRDAPDPGPAVGPVDADMLRGRWPGILDAVRDKRKVAWMLLNTASVQELNGSVLTIAFPSAGNARGFASSGHDQVLIGVLAAMLGLTVRVRAVAGDPQASGPPTAGPTSQSPAAQSPAAQSPAAQSPAAQGRAAPGRAARDRPAPGPAAPGPAARDQAPDPTAASPAAARPAPGPSDPGLPAPGAPAPDRPASDPSGPRLEGGAGRPGAAPDGGRSARAAKAPGGPRAGAPPAGGRRAGPARSSPAPSQPQAAAFADEEWPDDATGATGSGSKDLTGMELIRRQLGGQVIQEIEDT